jgi:hypothetical protein
MASRSSAREQHPGHGPGYRFADAGLIASRREWQGGM